MRYFLFLIALVAFPISSQAAGTETPSADSVWISTPYPALRVPAQEPIQLSITVHNAGTRGARVDLEVDKAPEGWSTSLMGDGRAVGAVYVGPENRSDLKLRVTPPENAKAGTYRFRVIGKAGAARYALPIDLTLDAKPTAKLSVEPEFPALRGAPDSEFTFKLTLRNESGRDALVGLEADSPPGFQTTFSKEFGTQQITSMPVKAGSSENIEVKIKPSQGTKADEYQVRVRARTEQAEATADLTLTVTGQPELSLTGPDDRISGRAYAGEEAPLKLVLANFGTSPARNIELSSNEPSGWKVKFDTKKIGLIGPGETREVQALITPSRQAVAGDYMVTMRANGEAVSDSSEFRITVQTSTIWGAVGIAVIGAALLVLVLAMVRYGRR